MRFLELIHFTSRKFLITAILVITTALSACGSPAEATTPGEVNQASASQTPVSEPTLDVPAPNASPAATSQVASTAGISFSKDVFPIFEASCIKCHGVEKVSRGLNMTSYEKTLTGSVKGPVIVPGDPAGSLLVKVIVDGKMPKQGAKLTPGQIEIIKSWISQGAPNN